MLRGTQDPQPAEARNDVATLELQEGDDGMDVVEDVETAAMLEQRRDCNHAAAEDEHLQQQDHLASAPDHACGDVVDEDEAEEERQRLRNVGAERLDPTRIGDL